MKNILVQKYYCCYYYQYYCYFYCYFQFLYNQPSTELKTKDATK